MINNSIWTKKRSYKFKNFIPPYLKCLELFKEKNKMDIDEMIIAYKNKYREEVRRDQAHSRIYRLCITGHIENVGLKTYRLIKKKEKLNE